MQNNRFIPNRNHNQPIQETPLVLVALVALYLPLLHFLKVSRDY